MEEYKKMTTDCKIVELLSCNEDKETINKYIEALKTENKDIINYYEQFGDNPRTIIMNVRSYERGLLFGFENKNFNKYGWLETPKFLDIELFEFPDRQGFAVLNNIQIGKGKNNKWTFGRHYSHNTGGCGYGLNEWGKIFNSRKECLIFAIMEMMTGLKEDSSNTDQNAKKVIKQLKELLNTIRGQKAVQLSLF